jgi:hypothetical protein
VEGPAVQAPANLEEERDQDWAEARLAHHFANEEGDHLALQKTKREGAQRRRNPFEKNVFVIVRFCEDYIAVLKRLHWQSLENGRTEYAVKKWALGRNRRKAGSHQLADIRRHVSGKRNRSG